ncbi:unnamed protein product, partial [Mesorhabditis belari]|uniref:Ethanolaminephosphotransferase n=1 Tax=Mesorhabditis belari TaxID=2138241 RepID=A0AAF3EST2_9BILA
MGLHYDYLTKSEIKGFDTYKYSCIDNSPLAVYISHPFWNWFVNFYPRWIAPNVLTLSGWALVMGCFLLETVLDYDLTRGSLGSTNPLPAWFWLLCAICTFSAHTLDGTDGKQARRIGASGPTGELFDHGLDSWSTVPFTITIFSVFGQGEFSIANVRLLLSLISVQLVFIVTHWEKYNTGVLFLSWGYDASQYGLALIYLWTWYVGFEWYKFYVIGTWTFAEVFEIGFYLSCGLSLAMSGYNMWHSYAVDKTAKQANLWEAVRPMVPCVVLFLGSIYWAAYSPTQVIQKDPRMFFFAMGTVFSNIACRLIISQMANTHCQIYNSLLALYMLATFAAFQLPDFELTILRVSCLIIVVAHVHYGVCVVRQLCAHFGIHALDVTYLEKKNRKD